MLKLIVLVLTTFLLVSCLSMSVSKRGQVQLCGRRLAEALNLMCQGQYYDPDESNDTSRRSLMPRLKGDLNPAWFLGLSSLRNESRQFPQKPSSVRQQRGVVDECCRQPCSPSTLLSYCGK